MAESDNVLDANPLCTLHGEVVHGKGKGNKQNMPTANIDAYNCGDLPELGVYASLITVDKERYIGVTNIGYRPSVDDEDIITVETHIMGFDRNIYGQEIMVELYHFLRPTRQFDSLYEVKKQVDQDLTRTKELFNSFIV
ncbi:MAG: hypothetical protein GX834_03965 [Clostridiaceae bacterium]|nr:hypothetical protein [Clostridiaceae bacterium]